MPNTRGYRVATGDDGPNVPLFIDRLAEDVANDVDELDTTLQVAAAQAAAAPAGFRADPAADVTGGFTDLGGRATWLTHDGTGGPTAYARDRLGMVTMESEQAAGGFLDKDLRETDLVYGPDGHITQRVMDLWKARLGLATPPPSGLTTTDTRVFWGHSMAWGMTNGATPIGTYLAALLGKTVINQGIGGQKSYQIGARVLADQTYRAAVTYLWPARNDLNKVECTPELAVYWTRRMLEHQTAVRRKTLVFEESPFGSETYGSAARTDPNGLDAYNTAIRAAFPDVWVPLASWMLTDAAAAAVGLTYTSEDNTRRASGLTPASFLSDTGHYNSLGNQAAAYRIHQEEQLRGWI